MRLPRLALRRERPELGDRRVEDTPTGLLATGCRAFQPVSSIRATGGTAVDYTCEVTGPYSAVLTKSPADAAAAAVEGFREATALPVRPSTEESCRVWFRPAMTGFAATEASMRAFQDAIFARDAPIVQSQRPKRLPLDARAELHCAADRASAAYRRYPLREGVRFGTCRGRRSVPGRPRRVRVRRRECRRGEGSLAAG